jgi:hypothetical protein
LGTARNIEQIPASTTRQSTSAKSY